MYSNFLEKIYSQNRIDLSREKTLGKFLSSRAIDKDPQHESIYEGW
jgi:hypothetical protein